MNYKIKTKEVQQIRTSQILQNDLYGQLHCVFRLEENVKNIYTYLIYIPSHQRGISITIHLPATSRKVFHFNYLRIGI